VIVGVLSAVIFSWRIFTWPFAAGFDAWAYMMWGRSIISGDRPDYLLSATTPKPMGTILGAVSGPFPPRVVFALQVAIALGFIVAVIYRLGTSAYGPLAGGLAALAFVIGSDLDHIMSLAFIDAVVAAVVVGSALAKGWRRTTLCVVTGLFRPEGWLLAGLSVITIGKGSLLRRISLGALIGALPAALWVLFDLLVGGDALATIHWTQQTRALRDVLQGNYASLSWTEIPETFVTTLFENPLLGVVASVGALGLVVHVLRSRESPYIDRWPEIMALVWTGALVLELLAGLDLLLRYLLPVFVLTSLGWAHLLGPYLERMHVPDWASASITVVSILVLAMTMDVSTHLRFFRKINRTEQLAPGISEVSRCGRIGVTGGWRARHHIPMISVLAGVGSAGFNLVDLDPRGAVRQRGVASVLRFQRRQGGVLPDWSIHQSPLGPIALSPGCPAPEGWPRLAEEWRYPLGNPDLFRYCRDSRGLPVSVCVTRQARAAYRIYRCPRQAIQDANGGGAGRARRSSRCLTPQVEI
jgi:hypothetical protein